MHRFFVPEECFTRSTVVITGKIAHQLRNVLRLGTGELITVLDNTGWEYRVEIKAVESSKVEGKIVNKTLSAGEPRTRITLYQALLKAKNFEVVLQKCTEVGVTAFVPTFCERCVAGQPSNKRLSRWQDIIRESAEQSQRGKLPVLHNTTQFSEACRSARGVSLMPWEDERTSGIRAKLRSCQKTENVSEVNIFVGPEGGFSSREVEFARSSGIVPVSLGRRILRAETAGLVAAVLTLYEFGEMDSG